MMMPANFSVVAENEMTYVVGGGVIEAIGSVTAPIWTTANVKTFNTNLVTIIGNSYVSKLVGATLGVMFGGNWGGDGPMSSFFGDNGSLSGIVKYGIAGGSKELNGFNKFMQGIGALAAVYTLGTSTTKSNVAEGRYDVFGNGSF